MKKLFLIIAIPTLVIVLAVAALLIFVDPNQFKPLIIEKTQQHTGMGLVIEGDIEWRLFPSLGLSLGKTELKNPQGFKNENLLKIDGINVNVSVMPLFDKELFIDNIILDGAEIYLETKKDGSSNLDALAKNSVPIESTGSEDTMAKNQVTSKTEEQVQPWAINLVGVSVSNALLERQDESTGSYTKLYDVDLSVSEFAFEQWTTVIFSAKGQNNQQAFSIEGQAELTLSSDFITYQLRNIILDSSFKDPNTTISSARIELSTFSFDHVNPLTVSVKGNAAALDVDLKLISDLFVDSSISQVRLEKMALNSTFKGASLPQSPMKITAKSDVGFDVNQSLISLNLQDLNLDDVQLNGYATVKLDDIPKIAFNLHSPDIDLDKFLGLNNEQVAVSSGEEGKALVALEPATVQKEVEPDLSALQTLDVEGRVAIDKFKSNNVNMQNVVTSFTVNRGIVALKSFTSNLYHGSIKASGQLDARQVPASYWVKKQIQNIDVQPLLKDVADNEMLAGTGDIDVDVKGKSLMPTAIKQHLSGTIKINFADGAINGINVAQLIRVKYAKIKGQKVDEDLKKEKKTDFSAMSATMVLSDGELTTDNMSVSSPLLRIRGKGKTNYVRETMNFQLDTSIVGTLEGQGGKDIDELKDITIPVRVYNNWIEPKYKVEFDQLWKRLEKEKEEKLKKKAEKELDRILDGKVKDEKVKELTDKLLKNFFN